MELIQQVAALITVFSAGLYFITVLAKTYKMFKTNEVEIKKEAKEVVGQVVEKAEVIKAKIQEKKNNQTSSNEPPQAQS
ncbi:MAG: hypothetical protein ACI9QC_000738 [Oceanicoccus sp.]|jgi:hypothetical protein